MTITHLDTDSASDKPTFPGIPDGFLIVVKEDCPTCVLVQPVIAHLVEAGLTVTVASQDNPNFPADMEVTDDSDLEISWRCEVEATPTVIAMEDGAPGERIVGWHRSTWETFLGVADLAPDLPEYRPACGSKTLEPGMPQKLAARFDGEPSFSARLVELGSLEDEQEAMFDRGWTDGLPVVPPTTERVVRMLEGTTREPDEVVRVLAPDYQPCTVEKAAINAVMAGCRPEYLPVVLAAVAGVATDDFNLHGVAATTWHSGVVIIVNGPIGPRIGMNSGLNVFGPGNRANASIGRAVNLIIRNIGGARPGGIDRSTQGHPAKYTLAFCEREDDSPWSSLATERGVPADTSSVTLFAGQGPAPFADNARDAESLVRSFASRLHGVQEPAARGTVPAVLAVSPEHASVFARAGWSKQRLRAELTTILTSVEAQTSGLVRMKSGRAVRNEPDDLAIVHVGGDGGLYSGIITGWITGPRGSRMVTVPVEDVDGAP